MTTRAEEMLRRAGMTEAGVSSNVKAFAVASAAWTRMVRRGATPTLLFVPGRIEVLGKHTDYPGGSSLTCAVERGLCIAYSPRRDRLVRLSDTQSRNRLEFPVDPELEVPTRGWSTYPMTVARRIARNFGAPMVGADVAFESTLPRAAGLSSSSALVTALFLVLSDTGRLQARPPFRAELKQPIDLAAYLGSVENGQGFGSLTGDRGVGTFGGSEDHVAILCSEPGRIGHFEFCPARRLGSVPVPGGFTFVVASSGVVAAKTGNARERYNRASRLAGAILERWNEATGRKDATLGAAVRSDPGARERMADLISQEPAAGRDTAEALGRRLAHFVLESEVLVPNAGRALAAGDLAAFGAASDQSQQAADELLGNQVAETIALAHSARALGAAAASAFGAGFGGGVWALVREPEAPRFLEAWRERYRKLAEPGVHARSIFFVTAAGPPATRGRDR